MGEVVVTVEDALDLGWVGLGGFRDIRLHGSEREGDGGSAGGGRQVHGMLEGVNAVGKGGHDGNHHHREVPVRAHTKAAQLRDEAADGDKGDDI